MNYGEAIQFLYDLRLFGAKLGLENTLRLAEIFGNPHHRLRFIHVAGTNGKGSICAMLEAIYRAAGLRVGLFTSPHLVAFGERIQVNRRLIAPADVVRLVQETRDVLQSALWRETRPGSPTFFEAVTVIALRYFLEQKCDLVIWETGLGGRLDATNIVNPLASVITNIQYDHEKWLGHTLAEIAAEKAGIIKPGVPVLTATEDPDALEVIRRTALERNAPFTVVSSAALDEPPLNSIELGLPGEHQRLNAALALATVRVLSKQMVVSVEALRHGLTTVQWPGRFQIVREPSGRTWVFDGAHNPAGAEALRAALLRYFPNRELTLVLGTLQDKDWNRICGVLAPLARRILLAPVSSERSAAPVELQSACARANPAAAIQRFDSIADALACAQADPFVVVTGSLHFIGEAMECAGVLPSAQTDERGLNEWTMGAPR